MLKLRAHRRILVVISLLALLLTAAVPARAWDYDEPVIVDGIAAYYRSLNKDDRDNVEGHWGMFMDWQPEEGANQRIRLAVVKNDYGVYEGADYVGVNTCDRPGCVRGEIKLALKKTDNPIRFDATFIMGGRGIASGMAVLGIDNYTGREDSALSLNSLRYQDRHLTYGMIRIMDG